MTLDRDLLPDAARYFEESGLHLIGRGRWRSALCCFHDDHNPSLRVNIETGAYRCMSCGTHGGDVIEFHRNRYGLSFRAALADLGLLR